MEIRRLSKTITTENIGDVYEVSIDLFYKIKDPDVSMACNNLILDMRSFTRKSDIGWKVSSKPPNASHQLSNKEVSQLIGLVAVLHSFCYGIERLEEVSELIRPENTPIRFYINSIYHYISVLYLLDKNRHDPMGGMVYKTLKPMGLSHLMNPVNLVLLKSLAEGMTFGETVRNIRNKFLVHGTFSPDDIASIIQKTDLHNIFQQFYLTELIRELFDQTIILKLKITALLTDINVNLDELVKYLHDKTKT